MSKFLATLLLIAGFGIGVLAGAQNLDMTPADRSGTFEQAGKPTRGMSQARVEANFGAPQSTRPPVGDPPISRWEYADFVVFFEYDKVIHSVTKR